MFLDKNHSLLKSMIQA